MDKIFTLTRLANKGETCTLGELSDGTFKCYTLEDLWLDNAVGKSCIPEGEYRVSLVKSPKFGRVYGVADVPGRTHILIHAGNTHRDTIGCILLGFDLYGDNIGRSRAALDKFQKYLNGESFILRIVGRGNSPKPA